MSLFSFEEKEEWKNFLTDESREVLENILYLTKRHKGAYVQSDDVKTAQLWSALIEIKKQLDEMKESVGKLKEPWLSIVAVGEAEKKRTIEKMVTEIIKPTDEDSQEATNKLVESLMKF